mmetsp:Transcript_82827/g.192464  ORF Transcript_82827/g.192464 Transcript_82827/m.192464 type:complete len:320 (-) Transcript_82827:60-1019(-)
MAPSAKTPPSANPEAAKPKKAATPYILFGNKVREDIAQELKAKGDGKASLGDIAKEIAARWAALGEAEKKEFEDLASEDKTRYASEFKVYLESSDPAGALRAKYAHMIPKKPLTAYFLFNQDPAQRERAAAALKETGSETGNKQITSKLAELWKAASAEEKAPYEERYKQEHADFVKKQMAWQATPEFAEIEAAAKRQADGKEEVPEKGTKRRGGQAKPEAKVEATPKVKSAVLQVPATSVKRARKAKEETSEVAVDTDVLAEADKFGLGSMLKNLASRPEVMASGKSSKELFKALQASGGLVNPAKRALLVPDDPRGP